MASSPTLRDMFEPGSKVLLVSYPDGTSYAVSMVRGTPRLYTIPRPSPRPPRCDPRSRERRATPRRGASGSRTSGTDPGDDGDPDPSVDGHYPGEIAWSVRAEAHLTRDAYLRLVTT